MKRKFTGLRNYFDTLRDQRITLTFSRIEELIGEPLCASARKYNDWHQSPPTHTITRCWVDNGYRIDGLDLVAETIIFEKI